MGAHCNDPYACPFVAYCERVNDEVQ